MSHSIVLCAGFKRKYGLKRVKKVLIWSFNFTFAPSVSTDLSNPLEVISKRVFSKTLKLGLIFFNSSSPLKPMK